MRISIFKLFFKFLQAFQLKKKKRLKQRTKIEKKVRPSLVACPTENEPPSISMSHLDVIKKFSRMT